MWSLCGKKAFTLAEVLMTLGIIGVLAAMILPTLLENVQKHVLAIATKQFHSHITSQIQMYLVKESADDLRYTELFTGERYGGTEQNAEKAVREFFRDHFQVVKECNSENLDKCFAPNYKNPYNGTRYQGSSFSFGEVFLLSNGVAISMNTGNEENPIELYVDINGPRRPNVIGYDMWNMYIFYDGVIDESGATPEVRKEGNLGEVRESKFENCRTSSNGCFGHFLNNNYKIDY